MTRAQTCRPISGLSRPPYFGPEYDGDVDILVNNNGQPPQLLRNDGGNNNHWLEIFLVGTKSNRDGVGARVKASAEFRRALRRGG